MNKSIALIKTEEIYSYIRDIRKIPVITKERQNEICKELQREDITEQEKKQYYDELVKGNLRFVISVAKQYQGQGLDLMDLISEGNLGLIKAAERFDHNVDIKFFSYAVWWIKQTITSSLNQYSRTIRLPSNVIQDNLKSKKKLNLEGEEYSSSTPYCISLSNTINDDGDTMIDVISNPNSENVDDLNNKEELKFKIGKILNVLDDREKYIIENYFGINGYVLNLEDMGEELGCTKERVRQLKEKAIKKLRNESYNLLDYL